MSELPPTPPPAQSGPKSGRWLKIALAVSLALNLAVAGLVGGAMLGRGGPDDAPAIRTLGLGPFALALSREGRDEVRGRIESDLPRLRTERMAVGRGLLEVQRALVADPFDRAAAEAALARSRAAAMALQGYGHAALLDTLEEMSLAERSRVAERLGRAMRRIAGREGRD
ncbi:periplasmic heavy metal sensor [Roseibacterium sp. SDUM158016]|uniref:periplasmic heavy metal sensor n=1 Tax=Roseicyclus sediminis TaxID=2980997 RepID=UPI0021CE2E9F|nr:periplasmic heavy metal sensor [Roseibacterium sp. SDUM158016]MCU4654027.1 periplasmic heavy metal sensor [Roseibacterium sp. SDUM158016]